MSPSPVLSRRHTLLRFVACAVLAFLGATFTVGCLVALFLMNLSFFGEQPRVPLGHTLLLLAGAAAGIGVPALITFLVLDTWRRRLVVVAVMPAVLLLGCLLVVSILGV